MPMEIRKNIFDNSSTISLKLSHDTYFENLKNPSVFQNSTKSGVYKDTMNDD